jgi:hypothetical protein
MEGGLIGPTSTLPSQEAGPANDGCWTLPIVDRVRIFPAPGRAAAVVNAKIMGSTTGPTNGFVDIASIASPPNEGTFLELAFTNTTPYRYVTYYGPAGSYGAIAELELYAGTEKLKGAGFGVAGSLDGGSSTYDKALDGDPQTAFVGSLPDGNYVGLDLGADHETATPVFNPVPGQYDAPPIVAISTSTVGSSVRYTIDGTAPAVAGQPYREPVQMGTGTTTIKAIASARCRLDSPVAQASYRVGAAAVTNNQASIHIGNSLTDTIAGVLDVMAQSGGVTLDFHRFTTPGAGTQWLWNNPTTGFGEMDIKATLQTVHFDQMSLQPFPNEPCLPTGSDSDADYVNRFYVMAQKVNPNVLLWIYQQWPDVNSWNDCFSVGSPWAAVPWSPPIANPATWEDAVTNQLAYQEAVRKGVMDANPGKPVYLIPGGLALRNLKKEIEAGQVPGWTAFAPSIFDQGGTDIHLTAAGRWFITLVFYSCMFKKSPIGIGYEDTSLGAGQAAKLEQIAWDTVNAYPLSGVNR